MKHRMIECLLPEDFREHLRGLVAEVGSQTKVGRMFGCGQAYLSAMIGGRKSVRRVASVLGYVEHTVYVREPEEPQERRSKVRGGRS